MKTFLVRAAAGALAVLGLATGQARAGFTITLDDVTPSGANTSFHYTASIPVGDQVNSGDFFRIYDVPGLVTSTSGFASPDVNPPVYAITAPAGWSAGVTLSDPTPPPYVLLSRGDDPTVPNVTFTYNGTTPVLGGASMSGFQLVSTFPALGALKNFAGRDTKSTGPTAGTWVDSVGDIRVPGPLVPEPSSLISAAVGLAVLAGTALRRRAHS